MPDVDRLRRTLTSPHLAWIVAKLCQRLERGQSLAGTISLSDPTAEQRDAVARLFGCPPPRSERLTIRLAELESLLRNAEVCDSLPDAMTMLRGPIVDIRQAETEKRRQWQTLFDEIAAKIETIPFSTQLAGPEFPGRTQERVQSWLTGLRNGGLLRRITRDDLAVARVLLDSACQVFASLPAQNVPLAELAARLFGDSHALDTGGTLSSLVLRAIASFRGVPFPDDSESRREVWARVGVWCDELSAPVLVLNLPIEGDSLSAKALRLHAESGEPYRVSLRQLLRDACGLRCSCQTVFVCENPTVVAAVADRLGRFSKPLICLEGQPKNAGNVLLEYLAREKVSLRYHGDFDWPGIGIANRLIERRGVTPWRMDARSYRDAADAGQLPLAGDQVIASWDEQLTSAMNEIGLAVHEEQVLESLLADLSHS